MIETRRLKNVVIFVQTILSFVLSRKISSSSVVTFIPVKQYRNCILLIHMKDNAHRCNLAGTLENLILGRLFSNIREEDAPDYE